MKEEKVQSSTIEGDPCRLGSKVKGNYPASFCRWLVGEIENGQMTVGQAMERFDIPSGARLIKAWRERYKSSIVLSLPMMTPQEKAQLESLERRLKEAEKLLEHARMKNIALETMVDIAEETLKIEIRKKPGPKQ